MLTWSQIKGSVPGRLSARITSRQPFAAGFEKSALRITTGISVSAEKKYHPQMLPLPKVSKIPLAMLTRKRQNAGKVEV